MINKKYIKTTLHYKVYMMHTFYSKTRDYKEWTIEPSLSSNFDPILNKLFSNDVFTYENNVLQIVSSPVRNYNYHTGVLILQGNMQYGKAKKGKLYYKCIPNDKSLPIFLIPYDLRIGFTKDHVNKYVLFSFNNWDDKHPIGTLSETFGNVDNFSSFCSYQLWCNKLVYSIAKFNRQAKLYFKQYNEKEFIDKLLENKNYDFKNKLDDHIFSIDPQGSKDIDDAISISQIDDNLYKITIYIANVAATLCALDMWESISDRVSTIYLPENKKTMLPEILSDDYCSLLENKTRPAFAMEVIFDNNSNTIKDHIFYNAIIKVNKNYSYNEKTLLDKKEYIMLENVSKILDNNIIDSHDVISYWMITMNKYAAITLHKHNSGVFRIVSKQKTDYDGEMRQTLQLWNNYSGSYQLYSKNRDYNHETLNVDCYVHVTSPIRRLVDVINQLYFFDVIFNISLTEDAYKFIQKFENNIGQLNIDMKSIRKVQSECDLLYLCKNNDNILKKDYDGIIFSKKYENNNYIYSVYIKELNKISIFKSNELYDENIIKQFRLFLFDKENNGHRKIRISPL